jgi:arginase
MGILWIDAHGDYNTPETTPSGYFGGMPLAVAKGLCHPGLWQPIGLIPQIPAGTIRLVGVHDRDPGERSHLIGAGVLTIPGDQG